jgi:hypothetical protein
MLLREKLEDQAQKKVELDRAVTIKKLELMKHLQQKLAGVGRTDDTLDAEIKALDAMAAQWTAEEAARNPKAKKLASLNVINSSGPGAGSSNATLAKASPHKRNEQD